MNGPVSSAVLGTTDVQAPGAPLISNLIQTSNSQGSFDAQLPGADADGSTLTGLKGLNYVDSGGRPAGHDLRLVQRLMNSTPGKAVLRTVRLNPVWWLVVRILRWILRPA